VLPLLRLVSYVETEVHVRIEGGRNVTTTVASDGARELAIEGLMDYACAVLRVGVGRTAISAVEGV
jgi:molybdopterin-binding protein